MLHNNSTKDHPTRLLQAFFFRTDARNQIRFGHELRENICLVREEVETVEIARKDHMENDTHRHNTIVYKDLQRQFLSWIATSVYCTYAW